MGLFDYNPFTGLLDKVSGGVPGPPGADGADGADGTDGIDGSTILTGSGPPAGGLGNIGDFYIDLDNGDLFEKTGASTWTLLVSLVIDVQKEFYQGMSQRMLVQSDFITPAVNNVVDGLSTIAAGAGAGSFSAAAVGLTNHPGVWRLATGTTIDGRVFLISESLSTVHVGVGGVTRWGSVFSYLQFLSTPLQRFVIRTGLMSITLPNTILEGIGFEYTDDENGGRWQAICHDGVETSVDTGIVVAVNTFYKLEFEVNALGTSVEFFIDDVSVATIATNIPQGVTFRLFSNIHIMKLTGTATRNVFIDMYYLYQELTR